MHAHVQSSMQRIHDTNQFTTTEHIMKKNGHVVPRDYFFPSSFPAVVALCFYLFIIMFAFVCLFVSDMVEIVFGLSWVLLFFVCLLVCSFIRLFSTTATNRRRREETGVSRDTPAHKLQKMPHVPSSRNTTYYSPKHSSPNETRTHTPASVSGVFLGQRKGNTLHHSPSVLA